MKALTVYLLVILAFLALVFGGQTPVFASEEASSIMCDGGVVNIGGRLAGSTGHGGGPAGSGRR